jgi:hypothetical protein
MVGPPCVIARLVAVHVSCDLCHATARIPAAENRFDEIADPFHRWVMSHHQPRLDSSEITINGHARVVKAVVI